MRLDLFKAAAEYSSTNKASIVPPSVSRDTESFSMDYQIVPQNKPVRDSIQVSPWIFTEMETPLPATDFTGSTSMDTLVTELTTLATTYSTKCTLFSISSTNPLPSGRPQYTFRIGNSATKPIIVLQTAIHGNEAQPIRGALEFFRHLVTSASSMHEWLTETYDFIWLATPNPDGYALNKRRNGTNPDPLVGVNLNRNYNYYWDYAADPDKGLAAFSEKETQNIRDYIFPFLPRTKYILDIHTWSSRTTYGFLTDYQWPSIDSLRLVRSHYHYTNTLVEKRDVSGFSMTQSAANRYFYERRATRKPYLTYWGHQYMPAGSATCQLEFPRAESNASNAAYLYDSMSALGYALREANEAVNGYFNTVAVASDDILNKQSSYVNTTHMNHYSTVLKRLRGFTYSGLSVDLGGALNPNGTPANSDLTTHYASVIRPIQQAWPWASFGAASCIADNPEDENKFLYVAGGALGSGSVSSSGYVEPLLPPQPATVGSQATSVYETSLIQTSKPLPLQLAYAKMVYVDGYIYLSGGCTDLTSRAASSVIYRAPANTLAEFVAAEWAIWMTIQATEFAPGFFGHGFHVWDDAGVKRLVIISGESGASAGTYLNSILTIRLDSGAMIRVTDEFMASGRGHFAGTAVYNGNAYAFGGYNGSTRNGVRYANLTTGVTTTCPNLSASRTYSGSSFDGANLLMFGGTNSGNASWTNVTSDVLSCYLPSVGSTNNGITTLVENSGYLLDEMDGDSEEDTTTTYIDSLKTISPSVEYSALSDSFIIVGGWITTSALPSANFWEYTVDTNTVHLRSVNDARWGYFRWSSKVTTTSSTSAAYTFQATLRNATDPAVKSRAPYVRLYPRVGTLDSSNPRKHRTAYVLPPRNYITLHQPVYYNASHASALATSGDYDIRAYLRLYGGGTRVDLGAMQFIKKPYVGVMVDEVTGRALDVFTYPIPRSSSWAVAEVVCPLWGSQTDVNVPFAELTATNTAHTITLSYQSTATISPDTVSCTPEGTGPWKIDLSQGGDCGVSNLGKNNVTGGFYVTINGVTDLIVSAHELNHDRSAVFSKRDMFSWRVEKTRTDVKVRIWFYGKNTVRSYPALINAEYLQLTYSGTGATHSGAINTRAFIP